MKGENFHVPGKDFSCRRVRNVSNANNRSSKIMSRLCWRPPSDRRVRLLVLMLLSFHNLYTQTVQLALCVCVGWWINGNKATIVQRCHVSFQQLIVSQICRFYWFFQFSMENCTVFRCERLDIRGTDDKVSRTRVKWWPLLRKASCFHSIELVTWKGRRSRNESLSLIITFVENLGNFPFSVPCKAANGNVASLDVCMMVTSGAGLLKKTSFSYFFHRYYTNTLGYSDSDSGLGSGKIKRKTISCLCLRWNFLFSISCQAIRWCCGMMLVCNFHIKR